MSEKIGKFGKADAIAITIIALVSGAGIFFIGREIKMNNDRKKELAGALGAGNANPPEDNFCCTACTQKNKENGFCAASGNCPPGRRWNGIYCEITPEAYHKGQTSHFDGNDVY